VKNIIVEINAGELRCNDCQYLRIFHTGLVGESHPVCGVFHTTGDWGDTDMKRPKDCIDAEKKARKMAESLLDRYNKRKVQAK